ncbi:unnamed protein product [Arabis nemorensis]|uniref:Uncharacterized protein n=1 Tax=Arabis nemorensis TaxID=586526 RepID=A0A565BL82_9BRAS|nr:unnamed protein product [Arabis nemorensis]
MDMTVKEGSAQRKSGYSVAVIGSMTQPVMDGGAGGSKDLSRRKDTNTKSFVRKKTMVEMLPFWDDDDVKDAKVENIFNVVFDRGWMWENSHWPVVGVNVSKNLNEESRYVKSEIGYVKFENLSLYMHGESRKRSRTVEEDSVSLIKGPVVDKVATIEKSIVAVKGGEKVALKDGE